MLNPGIGSYHYLELKVMNSFIWTLIQLYNTLLLLSPPPLNKSVASPWQISFFTRRNKGTFWLQLKWNKKFDWKQRMQGKAHQLCYFNRAYVTVNHNGWYCSKCFCWSFSASLPAPCPTYPLNKTISSFFVFLLHIAMNILNTEMFSLWIVNNTMSR